MIAAQNRWLTVSVPLLVICLTSSLASAQNPFGAIVRETEPLTPEEELKTLHVPDGFRVQLFAAEPMIQKPMNLAFDSRGRLWMSGSNDYPMPAEEGKSTDSIRVLEDTDGDGTADLVTTFVEDITIPIGLYPYRNGVIAFTIPNIWYFEDTDGDGRCDRRTKLYGPFDYSRDTHAKCCTVHSTQRATRTGCVTRFVAGTTAGSMRATGSITSRLLKAATGTPSRCPAGILFASD